MTDFSLPAGIDVTTLAPLVRSVTSLPQGEVVDWTSRTLQGGTVGEVHLLEGTAKAGPTDGRLVDWSLVVKVQRQWARPHDPDSWRREFLMYESGLLDDTGPTLAVPDLLRSDVEDDVIWLWLERVAGVTGEDMALEHYRQVATDLGRMQGEYLAGRELPCHPWFSSRRWVSSTAAMWGTQCVYGLGRASAEGGHHGGLPPDLSRATLELWGQRDRMLDRLDAFPRTLCHRDYHADNLFIRTDVEGALQTVALDWDCAGIGAISEDIGDMVAEAVVYFGYDLTGADELVQAALDAYVDGLRDAGWQGSADVARGGLVTGLPLQWCLRVACLARQADDTETLERYVAVQRFLLALADEARRRS